MITTKRFVLFCVLVLIILALMLSNTQQKAGGQGLHMAYLPFAASHAVYNAGTPVVLTSVKIGGVEVFDKLTHSNVYPVTLYAQRDTLAVFYTARNVDILETNVGNYLKADTWYHVDHDTVQKLSANNSTNAYFYHCFGGGVTDCEVFHYIAQ
jgi:hypothetical protein